MTSNTHSIIIFVLLPYVLGIAEGIRCFDCNSVNNSMCLDPTIYDRETISNFIRSVECNSGVFSPGHRDFFCRKIVQTILHKNHDSEVRVTRGCGWVKSRKDCYKADNEDHLETVCQCFTSDCNGATTLHVFSIVGTFLTTLSVLGLTYFSL